MCLSLQIVSLASVTTSVLINKYRQESFFGLETNSLVTFMLLNC